jgi:hypothetical protein
MNTDEPTITINGQLCTPAEAMTLRVALQSFLMVMSENGCGSDSHGRLMTLSYLRSGQSINEKMRAQIVQESDQ